MIASENLDESRQLPRRCFQPCYTFWLKAICCSRRALISRVPSKRMEFSPSSKCVVSGGVWAATTPRPPTLAVAVSGCVGHREFQSERRVAALQRAKACCHEAGSERVPEAATTASRVKKNRLDKALGDNDGPELARLQKRHVRTEAEAHRRDEVVGKGRARCV